MKARFISLLALFACAAPLRAMPETELDEAIASRFGKVAAIETIAESLRGSQADFADWVKWQREIHRSFEKAARYDWKRDSSQLSATLRDWDSFLARMREECEIYKKQEDD